MLVWKNAFEEMLHPQAADLLLEPVAAAISSVSPPWVVSATLSVWVHSSPPTGSRSLARPSVSSRPGLVTSRT